MWIIFKCVIRKKLCRCTFIQSLAQEKQAGYKKKDIERKKKNEDELQAKNPRKLKRNMRNKNVKEIWRIKCVLLVKEWYVASVQNT